MVDVHAFVPADLERHAAGAGFDARARARRGAAGELVRLVQPHARGQRGAEATSRWPGSSTPTAATCCSSAWTAGCSSRRLPPRIFYNLMLAARKPELSRTAGRPPGDPPSPLDMLRDKRAMVDTGVGPVAFVIVYAIAGAGDGGRGGGRRSGSLIAIERLVRRKPVINAIGGLFGTGAGRVHRVRSGKAEGYFVPRMLYQGVLARRLRRLGRDPAAARRASSSAPLYRAPTGVGEDRRVRRVLTELTLAWAGLFAFRAARLRRPDRGRARRAGWRSRASAMGWPAFLRAAVRLATATCRGGSRSSARRRARRLKQPSRAGDARARQRRSAGRSLSCR